MTPVEREFEFFVIMRVTPGSYRKGGLRFTQRKPPLAANELAVKIKLSVPEAAFQRLIPNVNLKVPLTAVVDKDQKIGIEVLDDVLGGRQKP